MSDLQSTSQPWESVWLHLNLATLSDAHSGSYGAILDGALAISRGRIVWIGAEEDLPPLDPSTQVFDGEGGWMTPGLIDCHTHLVYGGDRASEFERRLQGVTYEEIAREGGGILSTLRATRAASIEQLQQSAGERLEALLAEGVTTIEIKSGYGLDLESERKMLQVARMLGERYPVEVKTTFLGAHALPPEFAGRPDDYIDFLCTEVLPALAKEGLVDAVDAFCESIGFDTAQVERLFGVARKHNLPLKLHAEQLTRCGGAQLAATWSALSADHLERATEEDIIAMKTAGCAAVLLPLAYYFLRETHLPPVEALRAQGVPIAIATDTNPGSAPLCSLLLAMNMACVQFRLTPEEALRGTTSAAAAALGLDDRGRLSVGLRADLALWRVEHPAALAYAFLNNRCVAVVRGGDLTLDKRASQA